MPPTLLFVDDFTSLADALGNAKTNLDNSLRPMNTREIVLITDQDTITNPAELASTIDDVKNAGIVMSVINADPGKAVDWTSYCSDPDLLFEVQLFDSVQYSFFLKKNLCKGIYEPRHKISNNVRFWHK